MVKIICTCCPHLPWRMRFGHIPGMEIWIHEEHADALCTECLECFLERNHLPKLVKTDETNIVVPGRFIPMTVYKGEELPEDTQLPYRV